MLSFNRKNLLTYRFQEKKLKTRVKIIIAETSFL